VTVMRCFRDDGFWRLFEIDSDKMIFDWVAIGDECGGLLQFRPETRQFKCMSCSDIYQVSDNQRLIVEVSPTQLANMKNEIFTFHGVDEK